MASSHVVFAYVVDHNNPSVLKVSVDWSHDDDDSVLALPLVMMMDNLDSLLMNHLLDDVDAMTMRTVATPHY